MDLKVLVEDMWSSIFQRFYETASENEPNPKRIVDKIFLFALNQTFLELRTKESILYDKLKAGNFDQGHNKEQAGSSKKSSVQVTKCPKRSIQNSESDTDYTPASSRSSSEELSEVKVKKLKILHSQTAYSQKWQECSDSDGNESDSLLANHVA